MDAKVEGAQARRRGEAAGSEEGREAAEPLREEQRDADDADPRVEAAAREGGGPSDGESRWVQHTVLGRRRSKVFYSPLRFYLAVFEGGFLNEWAE